jgi:hypothetical protein
VFFLLFSATCAYDIFVDILYTNIEIIEHVRSEYKIAKRDIGIDIPSLIARILITILSAFLVLSKTSGSFLYPFIYSLRIFANVTIILVFF